MTIGFLAAMGVATPAFAADSGEDTLRAPDMYVDNSYILEGTLGLSGNLRTPSNTSRAKACRLKD